MSKKTKLLIVLSVVAAALILVVILYNSGMLGSDDYGNCFRGGRYNSWMSKHRGFGFGHGGGRGGMGLGLGWGHGFGIILLSLVLFALIIAAYLMIRNKNQEDTEARFSGNCPHCNAGIKNDWKTCPYCGHVVNK